ncbi:phosphoenolpyruvate mutase [Candidatus Pelagibacter bacterium]|nr:phosphoenolpyruvate mutase [Candidatus Pelagibacter bacterium]MDA9625099.1 phosphoenolpyruvate mutase [Candidatus Pelagibacter bacterium]
MKKNKIIYVPMGADIIHSGHLNIINLAKKYGKIVVGLFTDSAIAEYKSLPLIDYKQRFEIMNNLKGISKIVKQETWDYSGNLKKIKPDYLIHGDDWKTGIQKKTREKVIKLLKNWDGKLVEIPYTKQPNIIQRKENIKNFFLNPESRVSRLKRLIESKEIVRFIESHNPITGLMIENLKINHKNKFKEFDGIWSSSLTDSASHGKPDNQSFELSSRISNLNNVAEVTTKPILFDADNGGRPEHLPYTVRNLERLGVSAIAIEDKIGLKSNSLFKDQSKANQDSIKNFCKKIKIACNARRSKDFLIAARIESFILGRDLNDALKRAEAYSKAGADLILIHSKIDSPKEIFSFSKKFKKSKFFKPLIAVPSTYSKVTEKQLISSGFKIVIYANHLLRASYPAMENTALSILKNSRSYEAEKKIISIKKILNIIPKE